MKKLIMVILIMVLSGCVSTQQTAIDNRLCNDLLIGEWEIVGGLSDVLEYESVESQGDDYSIVFDGFFLKVRDNIENKFVSPEPITYTLKNGYIFIKVAKTEFKAKVEFLGKNRIKASKFSTPKNPGSSIIPKDLNGLQIFLTREI